MGAAAFCSVDNADRSNRTMRSAMAEVGLARSACVKWNVVPWVLPTRAPTIADIDAARPMLIAVLDQLPALEVIVTVGKPALHGLTRALWTGELPGLYRLVSTPHPSQRTALAATAAADRLRLTLTRVTEHIASTDD
jgi:uracil-DNA glycosylase